MLTDYIPHHLADASPRTAKYVLKGILNNSDASPRQLPRHNISAYTSERDKPAISTRSIIDSIDWHSLPTDHQLKPERDGSGWTPNERDLISTYARIRGTAAHALETAPTADEATDALHREISQIDTVENAFDMYSTIYEWDGSRQRMTPPDAIKSLPETPTEKLHQACKDGARFVADNWRDASHEHSLRILVNEAVIIVEVDGVLYCARPDQIIYTTDSPNLPAGIYTLDAKSTERIQPAHILQAEAQRRAVASRVNDDEPVHSILLRLSSEKGDWDIHTSLDDDWIGDKAWDMFQRKAETLYSDGLVQAELSQLD